jgi:LCP family protein required for cell wall assembly
MSTSSSSLRRRLWIGGTVVALLLVAAAVVFATVTWGEVNRVSIDRPSAQDSPSPSTPPVDSPATDEPDAAGPEPVGDPGRQVFLLVGSDSRDDLDSTEGFGEFSGNRADVIMVLFEEGDSTGLLSIPRDLLVESPCGGRDDRISAMLEGCDTYNGPTLLTLAVEEAIGEPIDHFALVDFVGFQEVVDSIGGYEICVENPVRDRKANLELDAGCTLADGAQTLAWMRSRRTQELTANGWRVIPGMNDLVRNERQRAFLIDMMARMSDITSPQAMASAGQAVAPFVTVDADLSIVDAVKVAWKLRGLRSGSVTELEIPVYDATTEDGASVLLPSTPVSEIVADFLSATAADSGGVVLGLAG